MNISPDSNKQVFYIGNRCNNVIFGTHIKTGDVCCMLGQKTKKKDFETILCHFIELVLLYTLRYIFRYILEI